MTNIAILGYGTVGSGVVEVITTNQESINKKANDEINIKYVLDLRDFPGDPIQDKIIHDFDTILNDDEIDIVVEVLGGLEPAYSFVKASLLKGKSVATSNKELVAKYGAELLELAKQNSSNFLFEASVGGGIPIIRPLNQSLTAEEITEITGILNGTTNYMLTKMADEGADFATVLKDAQNKGYAELHPEADVEGYDAGRKIAILSSLAYGRQVDYEDIYTEGITKITDVDFKYAQKLGASIKLLGTSYHENGNIYAMVCPMLIDSTHPLFGVKGVFNAVFIHGNMLDDAMFYGQGAGKLPTASAVVSDVVEAAKHKGINIMSFWSQEKLELSDINESKHKYFIRMSSAVDKEAVTAAFGLVAEVKVEDVKDEYAFITGTIKEKDFRSQIKKFDEVRSTIRIAG